MTRGGIRWWQIGLMVSVLVAIFAFFLHACVLLQINVKKKSNFPIFGVYFCMHQYAARAGCVIIAACQIVFLIYSLTMDLHVFDRPLYGLIPPIFGLFAVIVGMSLHLHCCIRWLFGWLLIGLLIIDITGAALLESDIHCLEDLLCDIDKFPDIRWLWVNFIVRNISLTANIYTILVCSFITWEMGCCWLKDNETENCCYRCDRYPLTTWEPMYDSRTTSEAAFDIAMANRARAGVRSRRLSQIKTLASIKRENSFSHAAATTTIIESRPSVGRETKTETV